MVGGPAALRCMSDSSSTDMGGELKIQTICLMILTGIASVAVLYWLRPVLIPFVLAVFLVCGIAPLLDVIQQRCRAPRIVAVAITFLMGIGLMAMLWAVIWLSVVSLIQDADTYRQRFAQLATQITALIPDTPLGQGVRGSRLTAELDAVLPSANGDEHGQDPQQEEPEEQAEGDDREEPDDREGSEQQDPTDPIADFHDLTGRHFRTGLTYVTNTLMDILSNGTVVLIFMFFLLLGGSSSEIPRSGIWMDIESKIRSYLVTKTVISAITGAAYGLVLWFFGIPLAVVFALLAFLLNFIPNIGPIIACLLPLPLIVLSPDLSLTAMIAVITISSLIQFVSGNVIEPKIMGDSFELHPVAILLALMIWGMLWGIIGMILATPVIAAMKILFDRFERTRPLAELLAGRFDALIHRAPS